MQRRALLLELDFHDLLCVVPCASSVCHEDRLIQTEDRNRDQIADEEERLYKGERKSREENRQEDIKHSFLRILGTNLNDFLAVFDRSFLDAFELDVVLDVLDRAISASGHCLHRRTGKPVDD